MNSMAKIRPLEDRVVIMQIDGTREDSRAAS